MECAFGSIASRKSRSVSRALLRATKLRSEVFDPTSREISCDARGDRKHATPKRNRAFDVVGACCVAETRANGALRTLRSDELAERRRRLGAARAARRAARDF